MIRVRRRYEVKGWSMTNPTVTIVDDDCAVRDSWAELLHMHGYEARQYADAASYLQSPDHAHGDCILLDIRMPGMSGMEMQEELRRRGRDDPIVFVTGYGNVGLAVKAMKAGAINFLQKPCAEEELIEAIRDAIAGGHPSQVRGQIKEDAQNAVMRLTEREREILNHVSKGLSSKVIARKLGISVRTVDIHRANMMHKTHTRNVVQLVRVAVAGGLVAD
jgi:two-component system response regulator FixJ